MIWFGRCRRSLLLLLLVVVATQNMLTLKTWYEENVACHALLLLFPQCILSCCVCVCARVCCYPSSSAAAPIFPFTYRPLLLHHIYVHTLDRQPLGIGSATEPILKNGLDVCNSVFVLFFFCLPGFCFWFFVFFFVDASRRACANVIEFAGVCALFFPSASWKHFSVRHLQKRWISFHFN